ncbi:type IV pilus assembly protein PilM [Gracilibacillus halotolerans]|uniref:Type IV pilus assembly protein PilM n=1 Tax=Gracilibacillus halotolerans TaxID=74386 RepID=A0A841RKE8_9BACI|nr:type IV pilus assembly protein PilM [Gracilibacillus halotolerans]
MLLIALFTKSHLSISIRDTYLRIIVTPNHEKRQVTFHQEIPIDEGIIEDGVIVDQEKLRMILMNMVQENTWKGATVSFFVHDSHINIRKIQVPTELDEKEIEPYILLNNESTYHLPISNPAIDFKVLQETEGMKEVLVFAYPKDILDDYLSVFRECKLKPIVADLSPLALHRLIEKSEGGNVSDLLLISLYADTMTLTAMTDGYPLFTRSIALNPATNPISETSNPWLRTSENAQQLLENQIASVERFMNFYQYTVHQGDRSITKLAIYSDHGGTVPLVNMLESSFSLPVISLHSVTEEVNLPPQFADVLGLVGRDV